ARPPDPSTAAVTVSPERSTFTAPLGALPGTAGTSRCARLLSRATGLQVYCGKMVPTVPLPFALSAVRLGSWYPSVGGCCATSGPYRAAHALVASSTERIGASPARASLRRLSDTWLTAPSGATVSRNFAPCPVTGNPARVRP